MQGEHRSERLRRDLEDVKNQPSGLGATVHTAAEEVRHRAQLADDASEEQLKVQTAFEKHGKEMQVGPGCAVLLALCCGQVMPPQRHALEGLAGHERPDSHQEHMAYLQAQICMPAGCCQLNKLAYHVLLCTCRPKVCKETTQSQATCC